MYAHLCKKYTHTSILNLCIQSFRLFMYKNVWLALLATWIGFVFFPFLFFTQQSQCQCKQTDLHRNINRTQKCIKNAPRFEIMPKTISIRTLMYTIQHYYSHYGKDCECGIQRSVCGLAWHCIGMPGVCLVCTYNLIHIVISSPNLFSFSSLAAIL